MLKEAGEVGNTWMRVTIRVIGSFRSLRRAGDTVIAVTLPPGSSVADALRAVGVGDDEPWNASIDGQLVDAERALQDGDLLFVFTQIGGGASRAS